MSNKLGNLVAAAMLSALASSAHAAIDWNIGGSNGGSSSTYTNERNYSASGVSLSISAISNPNGGTNTLIQDAYVGWWSGNGVGVDHDQESGSPQHSADNSYGYDMLLLSFSEDVNLETVKLGWWNNDSDISVMAYTGDGSEQPKGSTYGSLSTNGWELVGHYADVKYSTVQLATAAVSSFWLVGAYNPLVGTMASKTPGALGTGARDYVKLAAVSGVKVDKPVPPTGQVSEPASLALAGLALFGLMGLRRRGS